MLFEEIGQFHSGSTPWAITGDEWSPNIIDTEVTAPHLTNNDEIVLWIKTAVAADHTSGDEVYEFILRCSATNDATNLDGTVYNKVSTGIRDGDDVELATAGNLIFRCSLPYNVNLRYWQLFCETGASSSPTLSVYAGLSHRSAVSTPPITVPASNVGFP